MAPVAAAAATAPVVDSFTASPAVVLPGGTVTLTVEAHDPDCPATCDSGCGQTVRADLTNWSATGGTFVSENDGTTGSPYTAGAEWQAPAVEETYTITVFLADSGSFICGGRQTTTAQLDVVVTSDPNLPPVVDSLTALPSLLLPGQTSQLLCVASDPDDDPVTYDWQADIGQVTPGAAGAATYTAPADVVGVAAVTCTASDGSLTDSETAQIAVVGAEVEKSLVHQVAAPQRLAADSEGNLFVVDRGAINVINLFSEELVYRLPLADVTSVAVDWNDNLLVGGRLGVGVWRRQGDLVLPLDQGSGPLDVADVAVDRVNQRYAALYRGGGRVRVFDQAGAPVVSFGSTGDAPEQLRSPLGLAAAPGGDWLVADSGHGQIKRFDAAGNLLASFGSLGGGVGEFVQLDDVEVDGSGIVYASDSFQSWVQVFDPDGTLREALGGHGQEPGELKTPTGIVEVAGVDGLGDFERLVVASLNSSSLQVFRRDKDPLAGPPPSAEARVTPAALEFADTAVGQTSPGVNVSLSNVGSAILGVEAVDAGGPFVATHSCLALAPGETCSIGMTFAPLAPGPQDDTLTIDTSSGRLTVALSGQAFLPADLDLTPNTLGFSDQEVGAVSDPKSVTLTNIGTGPVEIATVAASAEYLVASGCPATLQAGAACTLDVRFAPTTVADDLLGTVSVLSSAAGSPHVVSLAGRGIPVIPRFSVRALDPDGIEEGDGDPVVASFEVVLDRPATGPTSVHYEVMSGSATPGEDFEPAAGQLEFAAGQTRQVIAVSVVGDEILEPSVETFSLLLWGPLAADVGDGSAEVSIFDDEVCLGPVLLANAGAETLDGASPIPAWTESLEEGWEVRSLMPEPHEGIAYFAAAPTELAELAQEVGLSELADAVDAGRQLLEFSARVRTNENDTARVLIEYLNWDKSVVLDRFDSGDISSPDAWQEVTDLRLAPPETRWVNVRLLGLRLTGPQNDAFFDAVSLRTIRAATVDVAEFSAYEGDEGLASAMLSVRLACPYHEQVFVDLSTADGTAVAGEDYLASVGTVSLPVGETEGQVAIDLVGDRDDEGHELFFVDVGNVAPAGAKLLTERAVGTILDDDSCPLRASTWAQNGDLLPRRMDLGAVVYGKVELIGFLGYNGQDLSLEVARELTATKLNLRLGSRPEILPVVAAGDAYLVAHPPGSSPDSSGDDSQAGREIRDNLKRYNNERCRTHLPPARPG